MTFNGAQRNYGVIDKELTALRWAVKSLRPFLRGVKFVIFTDHMPLIYLRNMSLVDGRLARTMEELDEFTFEIRHIAGKDNVVADALFRSPAGLEEAENADQIEDMGDSIPKGFDVEEVSGGGDSLY